MSTLEQALTDYLQVRRALGYQLKVHGKLLPQFLAYLKEQEQETITTEYALAWATLPTGVAPAWWAHRLTAVRGFAVYLQTLDPATEVPPVDLLPARVQRATPYLFSREEIRALIAAAGTLRSELRAVTYQTVIGLLAVAGLRVSEAIGLDRDDIDFEHDLIVVHNSKFGKSRELPLHPSTMQALGVYLRKRDELHPLPSDPAAFISAAGTRLVYNTVQATFQKLVRQAGLGPRSARCRPRLHALRHTFAVRTVLDGYESDGDVQARLGLLCTYMAHVYPSSTYWYLSAAPELLALAGQRLERYLGEQS